MNSPPSPGSTPLKTRSLALRVRTLRWYQTQAKPVSPDWNAIARPTDSTESARMFWLNDASRTNRAIEAAPMPTVPQVGVRNLRWTRANREGTALWTAIEKTVLARGRMVVSAEASAEVSTIRISSLDSSSPVPWSPNTAAPSPESTSSALCGLPRPMPEVPTPAKACAEVDTSPYMTRSSTVDRTAARPGIRLLSTVSSL